MWKKHIIFFICRQWSQNLLFQQYKMVVLVRLRDLAIQSASEVAEILPRRNRAHGIDIEKEVCTNDGMDILFILDGWDELPQNVPVYSLFIDLLKGNVLQECSIIITSRPISTARIHSLVSVRIEILGFTKTELHQYFLKCLHDDALAVQKLIHRIRQNPIVEGSCYLPLNASILVHLFKCRGNVLPTTQYGIFSELVCTCIFRHLKKCKRSTAGLKSLDDLSPEIATDFQHLCKVAYIGVMSDIVIFTELGSDINTLGLLQGVESFAVRGESYSYNFLHLSIQELLCAIYMATQLDSLEQTQQFKKLFGQPRFMLVFQFFAAKTKLQNPGISEIVVRLAKKCSGQNPSSQDRTLLISLIYCLYEAQDSSLCSLVVNELKQKLQLGSYSPGSISLNPADCYYLSYFLTFCKGFEVMLTNCSIGADHCKSLFREEQVYDLHSLE